MKPTAKQKKYFAKVAEIGCIACMLDGIYTPCEIHHGKKYGYRDHDYVYGLCPAHHKMTAMIKGVVNRHGNPIEFAEMYGTDEDLVEMCRVISEGVR